jgi:hypothetical protein
LFCGAKGDPQGHSGEEYQESRLHETKVGNVRSGEQPYNERMKIGERSSR